MRTKKYECEVESKSKRLTVNVFTDSGDKETIKKLAIKEAIKFQKETFNVNVTESELKPIGFIDCGTWD